MTQDTPPDLAALAKLKSAQERIREQIRTVVIGQEAVVEQLLIAIFAGGTASWKGCRGWRRRCSCRRSRGACR